MFCTFLHCLEFVGYRIMDNINIGIVSLLVLYLAKSSQDKVKDLQSLTANAHQCLVPAAFFHLLCLTTCILDYKAFNKTYMRFPLSAAFRHFMETSHSTISWCFALFKRLADIHQQPLPSSKHHFLNMSPYMIVLSLQSWKNNYALSSLPMDTIR